MVEETERTPRELLESYKAIGSPGSVDGARRLIQLLESLVARDEKREQEAGDLHRRTVGQMTVGAAHAPPPGR